VRQYGAALFTVEGMTLVALVSSNLGVTQYSLSTQISQSLSQPQSLMIQI
jgi:hypothetical protein